MKLKKSFKPKLGKSFKKNKFSMKNREKSTPAPAKSKVKIMPVNDIPIFDVCAKIKEKGYIRQFQEGDRYFLPDEPTVEYFYPDSDTVQRLIRDDKDSFTLLNKHAVWRPTVEDVFQILREEYGYHPTCCSQAKSNPNFALAFTKLQLEPNVELQGVIQAKSVSFHVAACIALYKAVSGEINKKWELW